MGHICFEISFLFYRQQNTNKILGKELHMSVCALEEPHDIDKYQHQIWNLPMHNYEQ